MKHLTIKNGLSRIKKLDYLNNIIKPDFKVEIERSINRECGTFNDKPMRTTFKNLFDNPIIDCPLYSMTLIDDTTKRHCDIIKVNKYGSEKDREVFDITNQTTVNNFVERATEFDEDNNPIEGWRHPIHLRINAMWLPDAFLDSFLYTENIIDPDHFVVLMMLKNTILGDSTFAKLMAYVDNNLDDLADEYNLHLRDRARLKNTIVEKEFSMATGMDIRLKTGGQTVILEARSKPLKI